MPPPDAMPRIISMRSSADMDCAALTSSAVGPRGPWATWLPDVAGSDAVAGGRSVGEDLDERGILSLLDRYPDSELVNSAHMEMGITYKRMGDADAAISMAGGGALSTSILRAARLPNGGSSPARSR